MAVRVGGIVTAIDVTALTAMITVRAVVRGMIRIKLREPSNVEAEIEASFGGTKL